MSKVQEVVLPAIERAAPTKLGLSTTRPFPKMGRILWGWRGSLADSSASKAIVSCRCRSPIISLPVAYRLYLPEAWASDVARRN
ncbi:hypothetical protein [Bradyrhizobium sp. USDA 4504]